MRIRYRFQAAQERRRIVSLLFVQQLGGSCAEIDELTNPSWEARSRNSKAIESGQTRLHRRAQQDEGGVQRLLRLTAPGELPGL